MIHDAPDKGERVFLKVNEFRDVEYLQLRKHYLGFEGEWLPGKEGAHFPLNISSVLRLFLALAEILSEAEIALVKEEFRDLINEYLQTKDSETTGASE